MWSPSISKETPPHSSYDWHDDPEPQYVITLSGMLEFATRDGPAAAWLAREGCALYTPDRAVLRCRCASDPWRATSLVRSNLDFGSDRGYGVRFPRLTFPAAKPV